MANLLDSVIENEVSRHKSAVLGLIEETRQLLDRIERDIRAGQRINVSSTAIVTDLFHRLGQLAAFDVVSAVRGLKED